MESQFLNRISIHPDWQSFFSDEIKRLIQRVEPDILKDGFTPDEKYVMRFLKFPLSSAKIIILGQDPYPQPGVATGRAFEVGTLKSWNQPFKNSSLKNILRGLYKAYTGNILKFTELKQKFDNEFPVLPPSKFFDNWEKQGVLLLNTSFTCEPGKPGSHQKYWKDFTRMLLYFANENAKNATWFLWGNHAREATGYLSLRNSIFTMHPMMCHELAGRTNDFLYGRMNCFEPFIGEIDWTGSGLREKIKTTEKLF